MKRLVVIGICLLLAGVACNVGPLEPSSVPENGSESSGDNPSGEDGNLTDSGNTTPPIIGTSTVDNMGERKKDNSTREHPITKRAPDADVEFVRAVQAANGFWTFHVTVRHPDKGWEDYADGWDVLLPDGTVLKRTDDEQFTRLLLHPHVNEQPFTRTQRGLHIPEGVTQVTVRAHDSIDGFGGQEVIVDLVVRSGANFEVEGASQD